MHPFFQHSDEQAMAAIAETINEPEGTHAIQLSPQYFSIWQLGEVDDDGKLIPERKCIAQCRELIRERIRKGTDGGTTENPRSDTDRQGHAGSDRSAKPPGGDTPAPKTPETGSHATRGPFGGSRPVLDVPGRPSR